MPTKSIKHDRRRGFVRQRGSSYEVVVYAGVDPLTGKDNYISKSTRDKREVEKIRTRLLAKVDQQRSSSTKATLRYLIESWLRVHELDDTTREAYELYARKYLYTTGRIGRNGRSVKALGDVPAAKLSPKVLEEFYAELRRCRARCNGMIDVDHRVEGDHECRTVRHRRPPGRPPAGGYPDHDCAAAGCTVNECKPHECRGLSPATIRRIHYIISGALTAAVRWELISSNPADGTEKPRLPTPKPKPPTPEQAAAIIERAWQEDNSWGMLVWLVMVTGMRRAEVLALRWRDLDFERGQLTISRNYVRAGGRGIEKDTKTHRERRVALDQATVELLTAHWHDYEQRVAELDVSSTDNAFLFSYEPDNSRPCDPSGISHRYARMCNALGLDSHLHALRHYSATELITSGVDIRTVAGRLGHGGGGTTTLRVYAAWSTEADKRAANTIASKMTMPRRASSPATD